MASHAAVTAVAPMVRRSVEAMEWRRSCCCTMSGETCDTQ